MKPPFQTYFGGKGSSGVYQTIINTIRPHDLFVEPYGGNYTISRQLNNKALKWVNDLAEKTYSMYPVEHPGNWIFTNMDALKQMQLILCQLTPIFDKFRKVIYLDPPYPLSSRKQQAEVYDIELTDQDHIALLNFVISQQKKADFIISTYPNEIYSAMLADWWKIEYDGCDRHGKTTEWLFLNYDPKAIIELHDISYYGCSYTERQRIKRSTKNTIDKIMRIDPIIQNHIIRELEAFRFTKQRNAIVMDPREKIKLELSFLNQLSGK